MPTTHSKKQVKLTSHKYNDIKFTAKCNNCGYISLGYTKRHFKLKQRLHRKVCMVLPKN